ncbi:MAG: chromosome partitioning protein ParB [Rhodobacteraceae bacterium CG17_big_fil_post_rev_8_21_14_2_50_65_11]|nr:MAG: chromosome partitioning protein ParB [Rhodobacteraceae bacterium CG17_big_fil_post_rev_8_21_14_2_50_65_11]
MTKFMPSVTVLPISDIAVLPDRLRPVSAATTAVLRQVIGDFGFTVPVLVRRTRKGFVLIDGANRLAVMTALGQTTIPVVAITCRDDEARALEASQNLAGAGMTPVDDAIFLAAYSAAYGEMHPETVAGVAGALAKHGLANELSSFAETIAEKRALTVRQVQKIARAGRSISREDADRLRGSPRKVTLDDLLTVAKIGDADERGAVVAALAAGKKAAAARKAYLAAKNGLSPAIKDPVDEGFTALRVLWNRVPKRARRRFAEHFAADLRELIGGAGGEGRA